MAPCQNTHPTYQGAEDVSWRIDMRWAEIAFHCRAILTQEHVVRLTDSTATEQLYTQPFGIETGST